jgi:hypothetical protein
VRLFYSQRGVPAGLGDFPQLSLGIAPAPRGHSTMPITHFITFSWLELLDWNFAPIDLDL